MLPGLETLIGIWVGHGRTHLFMRRLRQQGSKRPPVPVLAVTTVVGEGLTDWLSRK